MTTNAAIEFLIWASIAAPIIAVLAARLQISHDGLISSQTAMKMLDATDRRLNEDSESRHRLIRRQGL